MKLRTITKVATIASIVLWVAAINLFVLSPYAALIVAVLASLSQVVGVNSAQLEGYRAGERQNVVKRFLKEVDDGTEA